MKNLISMVDFVINAYDKIEDSLDSELAMYRYAIFLKQPLELWMFIACDDKGNVLEEPLAYNFKSIELFTNYNVKHQQAKERCLFVWQKGFDYKVICEMFKDLEDIILFEFELTETAQKQIFG